LYIITIDGNNKEGTCNITDIEDDLSDELSSLKGKIASIPVKREQAFVFISEKQQLYRKRKI
jgi:hypothetical protein